MGDFIPVEALLCRGPAGEPGGPRVKRTPGPGGAEFESLHYCFLAPEFSQVMTSLSSSFLVSQNEEIKACYAEFLNQGK